MNYKKIFKRETRVIAYVVIALTLVVIGTSYALFLQVNNNQDNQVVTAGSLVIEYSKGNVVTVDEYAENNCLKPQSDTTGADKGGCNFTLSITNKGTLPMQYDLLIYDDVNNEELPSDAQFVDHSLVRHSLNKQYSQEGGNREVVTDAKALNELKLKDGKRVLENSIIGVGETITFSLNIWISDAATVDIIGQYVYLKLDVVGSVYEGKDFSNYIVDLSKTDGTIVKMEHEETTQTPALTDYRYIGKNPSNYVCLEKGEGACQNEDNLYRIIGLIPTQSEENGEYKNRIKLIKSTNYEGSTATNVLYSTKKGYTSGGVSGEIKNSSIFNDILNKEYWDSLGTWQKYIEDAKWYFGASSESMTPIQAYKIERSDLRNYDSSSIFAIAKVGLMTISDYGFATSGPENSVNADACLATYITSTNFNTCKVNDWLSTNTLEYIYPLSIYWKNLWQSNPDGFVSHAAGNVVMIVRPSFYLKENVLILSGDGSLEQPFRII